MTAAAHRPPTALTIAGSDPSGGAGIQADLKTFAAFGVYGCAVLTALTAQSTRGVTGVHQVPAAFVVAQLDTLFEDVRVDAVKVGMVGDETVAAAVFDRLDRWRRKNPSGTVVVDPVMVATSGSELATDATRNVLRERAPQVADLLTPNLPEAAALLDGQPAATVPEMRRQATQLAARGEGAVVVKGGHLGGVSGVVTDVLACGETLHEVTGPAVDTRNTHGTGCTLSSALAASAARQVHRTDTRVVRWQPHLERARAYLTAALTAGAEWAIGSGPGPVDHRV